MNRITESGFEITNIPAAVYVEAGGGETVHKNRRYHGAVYNLEGEKRYHFGDKTSVTVRAREFLYLPKASDYIVSIKELGGCYAINFDVREDFCEKSFSAKIKNPAAMQELFAVAEREYRINKAGSTMRCMASLYGIFAQLQSECGADYMTNSKLNIILPAEEYISEHYTDEVICIEDMAELCGVSEVYLRKIFAAKFGMSPLKYINTLKLNRAKTLLETGMYPVAKAAELAGFKNECYFSREFKKKVGLSPRAYMSRTLR